MSHKKLYKNKLAMILQEYTIHKTRESSINTIPRFNKTLIYYSVIKDYLSALNINYQNA